MKRGMATVRCQGARYWFTGRPQEGRSAGHLSFQVAARGRGDLSRCSPPIFLFLLSCYPSFSCFFIFHNTHMSYARGWKTKVTIPRLLWVDEVISVQSSFARKECLAISLLCCSHCPLHSTRILLLFLLLLRSSTPNSFFTIPLPSSHRPLACLLDVELLEDAFYTDGFSGPRTLRPRGTSGDGEPGLETQKVEKHGHSIQWLPLENKK